MPDNTEATLQEANTIAVGRTVHPEATGMLQVDRSIELFGTSSGSVGFRAPATALGPIYTLPASDSRVAGAVLTTDAASNLYWSTGAIVTTIGASLGLAGSTLSTNERAFVWLPFAATITEVVVFATPSGSVSVGVWATGYASWPPTGSNAISGSPFTVSAGVKSKVTGMSVTLASDLGVMFNIDSVSTVEQVSCTLKLSKTTTGTDDSGGGPGGDYGAGLVHRGDSSGGRPYGGDHGGPLACP